jgi:hypothetical protein
MEEDVQENGPHAKAQRRKENSAFEPLRLCVRFVSSVAFVLCFALFVRCGTLWLTPHVLQNDPDGYWRLAANLVEHGTFGAGDVPTAFRPPLYPLLLTGCAALGDHGRAAVGVLHVLLGVGTVALVLALGRCWGLGRRGAALAALLVACDPILLRWSPQIMTETLATFLATAGLLALTWAGQRGCEADVPSAAKHGLAGVVLGMAALCRPAFLLCALAVAAIWIGRMCGLRMPLLRGSSAESDPPPGTACRQTASHRAVVSFTAFSLGVLLVLAPWAIRNQIQFGRPIVTTTHGGYTLLLANNPEFYEWLHSGSWGNVWQGDRFNADWARRRPSDDLQADRQAYAEAWQTIRAQPGTFLYACAVRIGRFWSPLPHQLTADESPLHRLSRYAVALWYVAEFTLAIVGIWRICTFAISLPPFPFSRSVWLWGFLLVGSLFASHVVYWTDMRMRAPVMPVVAIIAAGGLLCFRKCDD